MTQAHTDTPSRWGALSYPNYRRFWLANLARVYGLQFRFIGGPWLVTELTDSKTMLGLVAATTAISTILVSAPAGVLADRYDNRKLLVWSQGASALADAAIALLVLTGAVEVWMVVVWAAAAGSLGALGNPALNAILPRLIEMRVVASAVAATSAIWNSARIVGPAAAGIVIAFIGTGQALFATAVGFGLSTVLLLTLQLNEAPTSESRVRGGMLDGFRYVMSDRIFFATVGLSFFTSLFGSSYIVLLPVFAREILGVGALGFGQLEIAAGVGALLGTAAIVKIGGASQRGPLMLGSAAAFGMLIAAFAWSTSFVLSLALLGAAGFASSIYLNLGMTTLQVLVPNELRGRVMGVWSLTWVLSALGGLPAGLLAEWLGVQAAVALGALSVTAFALALLVGAPSLRRASAPITAR